MPRRRRKKSLSRCCRGSRVRGSERVPQVRADILDGGHHLFVTNGSEIVRIARQFLDELGKGSSGRSPLVAQVREPVVAWVCQADGIVQPPSCIWREPPLAIPEIHSVPTPSGVGLVKQLDLRREIRQANFASTYDFGHRAANAWISSIDPNVAISFVQHQFDCPEIPTRRPTPQGVNVSPRQVTRVEPREAPVSRLVDLPCRDGL